MNLKLRFLFLSLNFDANLSVPMVILFSTVWVCMVSVAYAMIVFWAVGVLTGLVIPFTFKTWLAFSLLHMIAVPNSTTTQRQ